MQHESSSTGAGEIRIHKNVISSITRIATLEIEGVKRIEENLPKSIMRILSLQPLYHIKVEINKNGEVNLNIPLVIKYGYNIPEIASRVQENVRQALEKMANVYLKDINVEICGIEK